MNMIKTEFINNLECSDSVKESFKMIFKKVSPLEEKLGKDLKDFNREELFLVLGELKGRSYNSVHTKWGITKKYLKHFNNSFVDTITSDDLKQFIVEADVRYVTREELREKISVLESASHKALLFLLFDGIGGKGYKEICNLKFEDIDFETGKITLENRCVTVSKDTLNLLKETKSEDTVTKILWKDDCPQFDAEYKVNMNSPYVFKTRILQSTNNGMTPYKVSGLQRRLDSITKAIGLTHGNGKTLYYSGCAEKYLKLEKKFKKQLSIQDINSFASVVGAETIQANTMYRTLQMMREK